MKTRIIMLALLAGLIAGGYLYADPPGRDRGERRNEGPQTSRRVVVHQAPRVVKEAPRGSVRIQVGPREYYHRDGIFYHHTPSGYVIIPGPIGARLTMLPRLAVQVHIGPLSYYYYYGTYYRYNPREHVYVVVSPQNQSAGDVAVMTDGQTYTGQYLGGDSRTIDFQVGNVIYKLDIQDLISITFAPKQTAP
jgi:hypothetical protein